MDKIFGVVGHKGSLGSGMTAQIACAGETVLCFDTNPDPYVFKLQAIDPSLKVSSALQDTVEEVSLEEVLERSDVVHWCAPSSTLPLAHAETNSLVILHDSVMATSKISIENSQCTARFAIAHCLMNEERTVVVAEDYG